MPIKPSDQEEFNEQISGFFRREPSPAEAKRKLAIHSGEMLQSMADPQMVTTLADYPVYAAVAFHGKFDWVDRRAITTLAAKNTPAQKALAEIRAKKAMRVAASAKPGWDSLVQASPEALWMAIQLNLAGWKAPMSGPAKEQGDEEEDFNDEHEEENEDDEH